MTGKHFSFRLAKMRMGMNGILRHDQGLKRHETSLPL